MAIQIPSSTTTFLADNPNKTYLLAAGENLIMANSGTDGISASAPFGGRTFLISGTIDATASGINLENLDGAGADRIVVNEHGRIEAENNGISVTSGRAIIENAGTIESGFVGVFLQGKFGRLINTGFIEGQDSTAVVSISDRQVINNAGVILASGGNGISVGNAFDISNTGTIVSGSGNGVVLGVGGVGFGTLVNLGTISGSASVIAGDGGVSDEHYTLINLGTLLGDVAFTTSVSDDIFDMRDGFLLGNLFGSAGDNRFILSGANITGFVAGGDGDDTFVVSTSNAQILEASAEGTDTVRAAASFDIEFREHFENIVLLGKQDLDATGNAGENKLTGNKGDNTLNGLAGIDTLRGGRGDDLLEGGDDSDTFVFKTGDGEDFITGFTVLGLGRDRIDLRGVKDIKSFDDLVANHMVVDGNGIAIRAGKDEIAISNVDIADFSVDSFVI